MGLTSYIFIGALALLGGGVSYGVWSLKRKVAGWAERRRLAKEAPAEDDEATSDDSFPIFDDPAPIVSAPPPSPPASQADMTAEFERLHKAVSEIAKAQVRLIEASGSSESENEDAADSILQAVKEEAATITEQLSERIDALVGRVDALGPAEGDDTEGDASQALLEQLADRPAGPDLQAISDLILPQIALLGEDMRRLEARVAEIAEASMRGGDTGPAEPVPSVEPDPEPLVDEAALEELDTEELDLDTPPEVEDEVPEAMAEGESSDEEEPADEDMGEAEVAEADPVADDATQMADAVETDDEAEGANEDDIPPEDAERKKLFGKGISYVPAGQPSVKKPSGAEAGDRMMV